MKQTCTFILTNCHIGKCSGNFCFPLYLLTNLLPSCLWNFKLIRQVYSSLFPNRTVFNHLRRKSGWLVKHAQLSQRNTCFPVNDVLFLKGGTTDLALFDVLSRNSKLPLDKAWKTLIWVKRLKMWAILRTYCLQGWAECVMLQRDKHYTARFK